MLLLAVLVVTAPAVADAPDYKRDIQPILAKRCEGCHGDDEAKSRFSLATFHELIEGGKRGPAIVPGNSAESLLIQLIERRKKPYMPPKKGGKPLTDEQIKLIRAWIDAGAKSPGNAPTKPPSPKVAGREEAKPSSTPVRDGAEESQVGSLTFSPDGTLLAVGSLGSVELLNRTDGKVIRTLAGHAEVVRALAFDASGTRLAAAGGHPSVEGEVKIWNVADGTPGATVTGHKDCIYDVAFSPDGKLLATCSYDRLVYLWDASTGEQVRRLKDHTDAVFAIAFTPDGKRIASAAADRTVKVWDVETGQRLFTLSESTGGLNTLAITPDGKRIAAAGDDKMIRVWDLDANGGTLTQSSFAHKGPILEIAYAPDGRFLYSTGEDRLLKVWEADGLVEHYVFEPQSDWNLALALPADGKVLGVGRYDGSFDLYDTISGKSLVARAPDRASSETQLAVADKAKMNDDGIGEYVPINGAMIVPPGLSSISPRAGSLGSEVVITLHGHDLGDASEVLLGDAGVKARIVSVEAGEKRRVKRTKLDFIDVTVDGSVPYTMKVALEIGYEARVGVHDVVVRTKRGTSNRVNFLVENLAEVAEREPNDGPDTAQTITNDAVVTGAINRSGDADYFQIEAQAGRTLGFEIVGSALGSKLQSRITLTTLDGTPVATSDPFTPGPDARLVYDVAEPGLYNLLIEDRELGAGGFYRLQVAERSAITDVFPLGVQKGATAEIAVEGVGLGDTKPGDTKPGDTKVVKVTGPESPSWGQTLGVPVAGKNGAVFTTLRLAVGDHPEIVEAEPNDAVDEPQAVTAPVTINGRIHRDDNGDTPDTDVFRFSGRQGERLILDVAAQRLGSPLDSAIEILDADGKPIERATLRCVAQTYMVLSDRDSSSRGLRLQNWADLRVNDYVMAGSEVMRITDVPHYSDQDVIFYNRAGQRVGFFGTSPEHHAVNTNVYKVEVHPPGATFAPNGMPIYRLNTVNDDGGPPTYGKDARLGFDPPADGDYLVRVRSALGDQDRRYAYRLSIRPPRPDFTASVSPGEVNILAGSSVPMQVTVRRMDGFAGTIHAKLVDLPPGFVASETTVPGDRESASILLTAGEGAASTPPNQRIRLVAVGTVDGKEVTRESFVSMISVGPKPDIELRIEPAVAELVPGGETVMTVHLTRNNGFAGRVRINVLNLPYGVDIADTGLNGVLITPGENQRTFKLTSLPWVSATDRIISVTGEPTTTVAERYDFASPSVTLRVTESPNKPAQVAGAAAR